MLLIAVCFQEQATCSCVAKGVNASSPKECLEFICKQQTLPHESVDEVLVVEGDEVTHQYTPEHWGKVAPTMDPIPEYGDLIEIDEFVEMCNNGGFIDYDGHGYYSNGTEMSNIYVCPSDITSSGVVPGWTHVVWFNR